jgi:hypothetical protein
METSCEVCDADQGVVFCTGCNEYYCEPCWDKRRSHKDKKKLGPGGIPHEKVDPVVVKRVEGCMAEPRDETEEREQHENDQDTTCFGLCQRVSCRVTKRLDCYQRSSLVYAMSVTSLICALPIPRDYSSFYLFFVGFNRLSASLLLSRSPPIGLQAEIPRLCCCFGGYNYSGSETPDRLDRDPGGDPVLSEYRRYASIMMDSASETSPLRYPGLVSFVGQTGAGKSTLIRLLIDPTRQQNGQNESVLAAPVLGRSDCKVPTSADVHLYVDPKTFSGVQPILFADFEGFEGGERSQSLQEAFTKGRHRLSQGNL